MAPSVPGSGETRQAEKTVTACGGGPLGGASGVAAGKASRVELGFDLDLIGGMHPRRQRREGETEYCLPRT